ncbi:MAG: hypothetical protein IJ584_14200 [Bacteroidales bacterium]|nr:hypothetical protein [Bacteroidales bacterium]
MKRRIVLLVCASLLSCSCREQKTGKFLDDVYSFIQSRPYSALSVLDSFDVNLLTNNKLKAEYSLVRVMSLDKNYIDTTDLDLIAPAVSYYPKRADKEKAMLSWLYQGRIYENRFDYPSAIDSYLRAKEYAGEVNNPYIEALLHSSISDVYAKQYNFKGALDNRIAAQELYQRAGNDFYVRVMDRLIAQLHVDLRDWEKADSTFRKFLESPIEIDSANISKGLFSYARFNVVKPSPDPMLAESSFLRAINDYGGAPTVTDYYAYAYSQSLLGDVGEAMRIVNEIDASTRVSRGLRSYWLYRINKCTGNYEAAIDELETAYSLQDKVIISTLEQSVLKSENRFYEDRVLQTKQKMRDVMEGAVVLMLSIALIFVLIYSFEINRKRKIERDNMALQKAESEAMREIASLQDMVAKAEMASDSKDRVISDLSSSYVTMFKSQFKTLDKLCLSYWSPGNMDNKESLYLEAKAQIRLIADDVEKHMKFEEVINSQLNGLMSNLRRDFPSFSESDFRLLSYSVAGFSIKTIACVLNLAVGSVYVKKSRLVKSMEKSDIGYKDLVISYLK